MAVQPKHPSLFPTQFLSNREMDNIYTTGMMYGCLPPMYGMDMAAKNNVVMEAESSGLTYAHFPLVSTKRHREESNNSINMNQFVSYPTINGGNNRSSTGQLTFIGDEFTSQIQHQQLQDDSFIAQHSVEVRLEIEERRKRNSSRLMAAVEEGIMKKLKAKEDEIQEVVKLNWALEERVKSLAVENQIWRDLAETNEATANILRSNLEQVLEQIQDGEGAAELVDDDQSCCGSNCDEEVGRRTVEDKTQCIKRCMVEDSYEQVSIIRVCRSCGKDEACVLLLPCRHLCLCSVCGSSQNICPICKSVKNCSLHVNLTC